MKIKIEHIRKNSTNSLIVQLTKGEKFEYVQAELLREGRIQSLLPFSYEIVKDEVCFSYDISCQIPLKTYLGAKLSLNQFRALLMNVIAAVEDCSHNNLKYTNVLFSLDQVYLNTETERALFAFIPASGLQGNRPTITDFLREIAMRTCFVCDDDKDYAHDLIDFLQRQTVFSLIEFKAFFDRDKTNRQQPTKLDSPEISGNLSTYDFMKAQSGSLSAREVQENQSLAERIAFDVANTPASPIEEFPELPQTPFEGSPQSSSTTFVENNTNQENKATSAVEQVVSQKSFFLVRISTKERFELSFGSSVSIGRSNRCDISIKGNTNISREHAALSVGNNHCSLTDNASTNKSFVNGQALLPNTLTKLERGSTFKLADEVFALE